MQKIKVIMIVTCLLITTGCWDSIEIEQRGFVIGAAIDLKDKKQVEKGLTLTQQFVVPGAMSTGAGGSSGTGEGEAFQNIESEGDTIFETVRRVAATTSRSPFYEHIKLLVISEGLARSDYFPDVLDYFIRYPEMRRGTQVMITPEKAKEILEFKPKNEKLPVMFIQSISKNNFKNARMVPPTRIGDVHENLLGQESFMIQMISKRSEDEVKISGHAVINGNTDKLAGFIGEEATEGVNFITGEIEGGLLEAELKGDIIVYEMDIVNSKIKPEYISKDNIKFNVEITTSGSIPETYVAMDLLEAKEIEQIEDAVEKSVRGFTELAIQEVQKELKLDIFGFGKLLSIKFPDEWEKIKDDWDYGENYFEHSQITVTINSVVSRNGAIIRSTLQ
ncbi:Ger(x)C family spore germination protein [Litchfieldia salsa]|uniref:Spore germination protein n=1 Tax=Litchfieldia salsa TaxID=930152 RepID=A0A1H0VYP6_9BACI|nr:Ger(x)C family spore germination protein [Litchfieldia salsa]SDP83574.1 spore germination protein [Litchfieldia salsa]